MSREDAYQAVQRHAMKVWAGEADFLTGLQGDPEITAKIPPADLAACFDPAHHTKRVNQIFDRVFGPEPALAGTGKTAAAG
jgi:adenylosuccinate lyase